MHNRGYASTLPLLGDSKLAEENSANECLEFNCEAVGDLKAILCNYLLHKLTMLCTLNYVQLHYYFTGNLTHAQTVVPRSSFPPLYQLLADNLGMRLRL